MTAVVLPFPGVDPAKVRPRPTCVADLSEGAQALVVYSHRHGFNVVIRPILTKKDEFAIRGFASARRALDYARDLATGNPHRFHLVVDQTKSGSLSEIMAAGPHPYGFGGAA